MSSEDGFAEDLDTLYGEVEICSHYYGAGWALRRLDPIAFREAYLDYLDSQGLEEE